MTKLPCIRETFSLIKKRREGGIRVIFGKGKFRLRSGVGWFEISKVFYQKQRIIAVMQSAFIQLLAQLILLFLLNFIDYKSKNFKYSQLTLKTHQKSLYN